MTEELREKIAKGAYDAYWGDGNWDSSCESNKDLWRVVADAIFACIKENYVRLAEDQSLPEIQIRYIGGERKRTYGEAVAGEAQQDMLDKGFRKVELQGG